MKKVLTLLMIVAITFSNGIGLVSAEPTVTQNGTGGKGGLPGGGGTGPSTYCTQKSMQFCVRDNAINIAAYRLTFVYAKDGNYKMVPNANNPGTYSDSMDFWTTKENYTKTSVINKYGGRSNAQASKIEYLRGVPVIIVNNFAARSTYQEGINFVHDENLNKFLDNGYDAVGVMEYFSGTKKSGYTELLELAKKLQIVKADATIASLGRIAKDSSGYILKLLIEPISYFMEGQPGGKRTATGGFFTETEMAVMLKGTLANYSVQRNSRATCFFPLRMFLAKDDKELGINAYKGSTICYGVGNVNPLSDDLIYKDLGLMVVDLYDLFGQQCPPVYRTISLSNPFPGHNGSNTRQIGANWYTEDRSLIKQFITNNRGVATSNVYNLEPMYRIVLTPKLIQNIRNYNKTKASYSYDDLVKCDAEGKNCQSNFIRSSYKSSFSGCKINGTC